MSQERMQILQMLAEGKITAEDADRLLSRLDSAGGRGDPEPGSETSGGPSKEKPLRWLRVVACERAGEKVDIRIPLAFVRAGLKLGAVVPSAARVRLEGCGVDLGRLGELDGRELLEALRELNVEVDEPDGDQVRIFCE